MLPNMGQFGSLDERSYIGNPYLLLNKSKRGITILPPSNPTNDADEMNLWRSPPCLVHQALPRLPRYIEPLPVGSPTKFEFENMIVGQVIPSNFILAIEKGFKEAANLGSLIGHPIENLRVISTDGASYAVDSSELAFNGYNAMLDW
ncbi:hypothetical protein L6164_000249 [Bauhinia variegata]|uniref:Uncharacterized protein n=1 Tax=Bauhinia variegata TaxID=167791 RepID=A0ACB9Q820_BAUVA|nr:hypothetical protein L6164_000249 [Bauhinia variegata]